MKRRPGISYRKRVAAINEIYVAHSKRGLSNREIWRRYVYPVYGLCERAFYNILKAPAEPPDPLPDYPSLFDDNDNGQQDT